jgi:hypothetical protein
LLSIVFVAVDSGLLDIKELVSTFSTPRQGGANHRLLASLSKVDFLKEKMRVKFSKIDVLLYFWLFMAEDPMQIR